MSKNFLLFLSLSGALWQGCKQPAKPVETTGQGGEKIYRSGTAKRTPLQLPDGTQVLMNAGSVLHVPVGFNKTDRSLVLDGEALFIVGAIAAGGPTGPTDVSSSGNSAKSGSPSSPLADSPFVVHTRALVTTVPAGVLREGSAVFKVNGPAKSPGEEIDLLSGGLVIRKSYHSTTDNEPETLGAGEMVMVNTDIDLMEKEKFDTAELKMWIRE